MKFKHIATAFLLVGMIGMVGSAAAQNQENVQVQDQQQEEAGTPSDVGLDVVVEKLNSIQNQLNQIQERLDSIEARMDVERDAEINNSSERDSRAEENLGSEVSEQAREGNRQGIFGAISSFLGDKGNAQEGIEEAQQRGPSETPEDSEQGRADSK